MLKNDILLRAANGATTERPPVWVMRQAGRILPEYRAVRASVKDFKALVKNPELVCEVTLQPVRRLGVDAAILFSDILVIPEAMGLDYEMIEARGPFFPKTITCKADVDELTTDVAKNLSYVKDAIILTKQTIDNAYPLIGFAGAPWTIFAYMIEGKGSKTFSAAKKMLYTQPELSHNLLQKITDATIAYLKMQIDAGVNIIQLFDSWAGILSPALYEEFSAKYLKQIADAITTVPKIVFAKDAHYALSTWQNSAFDVVGMDWTMDISNARNIITHKTLQGNMDPCLLYASKQKIEYETKKMIETFGSQKYIANLGHGVYPDIPWENVKHFIDTIKNFK
jgi:uroporphyrinogen decarboxylase